MPVEIPAGALLPRLWERALGEQHRFDVLLNLAYDWLPFWITPHTTTPVAHLVSMGSVADAMDEVIGSVARWCPRRLAFHTAAQAADFQLPAPPVIVGNGFDPAAYAVVSHPERVLGWAGRIAPEKGLEDAARVAHRLGLPLRVWGLREDEAYARAVEASVGGIRADLGPGVIAVPHQLLDYTWGRRSTFFEGPDQPVTHVDFTHPYAAAVREAILAAALAAGEAVVPDGVYATTQGPRLETAAEIDRLERDGATMVGMTAMPEAVLAREIGLEYATLAVVANHAAGRGQSNAGIRLEDINHVLQQGMARVRRILQALLQTHGGA